MARKNNDRAHIRMPADLKRWVVQYTKRRNVTLSSLVVRHLTDLRDEEEREREHPIDAEQV